MTGVSYNCNDGPDLTSRADRRLRRDGLRHCAPDHAYAQSAHDDWDVSVYPFLAWLPLGIGIDVDIPPFQGDLGGALAASSTAASMARI